MKKFEQRVIALELFDDNREGGQAYSVAKTLQDLANGGETVGSLVESLRLMTAEYSHLASLPLSEVLKHLSGRVVNPDAKRGGRPMSIPDTRPALKEFYRKRPNASQQDAYQAIVVAEGNGDRLTYQGFCARHSKQSIIEELITELESKAQSITDEVVY